ncbi:MAG: radical SAM protein [Elusimicrobiota bacterium]
MNYRYIPYQAKNILYRFDDMNGFYKARYSLNPYRGCMVGCRYCYIQLKKYADSTGLEEKKDQFLEIKINAPYLLKKKLKTDLRPEMIVIGESCEPYGKAEEKYLITRRLLEILVNHQFPIHIVTRFNRVIEDLKLLKKIDNKSFACVTVSIPVVSKKLVNKLEGNSPSVKDRLKTVKSLNKHGITSGIALSPVIPYISDGEEINKVLKKAYKYNASYVLYHPLVIKDHQKKMFISWLKDKYPRLVDPYKRLYADNELPEKEYRDKFFKKFKKKAQDLNLKLEVPYEPDIGYSQKVMDLK